MKKIVLLSSLCLAGLSAFALPDYEPFADASGSGGTTYTIGASLIGQTNAQGNAWVQAGPAGTGPTIVSGDLTVSGLASSGGGASGSFGASTSGPSARFGLGSSTSSGTIYFSMAIDVTSTASLTTSGVFFAGFNNTAASTSTQPSVVDARLYARSITGSPGSFNLGIDKAGTLSAISWDSTVYNLNSTIFVVGAYTFNTGTGSDDTAQLWINPNSSTFGNASAPSTTLVSTDTSTADIATVAALELRSGVSGTPNGEVDDLRIGTSWADVTPPAVVPEPASIAIGGLGLLGLIAARRFFRKHF